MILLGPFQLRYDQATFFGYLQIGQCFRKTESRFGSDLILTSRKVFSPVQTAKIYYVSTCIVSLEILRCLEISFLTRWNGQISSLGRSEISEQTEISVCSEISEQCEISVVQRSHFYRGTKSAHFISVHVPRFSDLGTVDVKAKIKPITYVFVRNFFRTKRS